MTSRVLIAILLFLRGTLQGTFVLIPGEELNQKQEAQLFDLVLRGEPPRSFYNLKAIDLKAECQKVSPSLRLEWLPPAVWQLGALHAFFHDENIRNGVLACADSDGSGWPLEFEGVVHEFLPKAHNVAEIAECFDRHSQMIPGLCSLFFQVNKAVGELYKRAGEDDLGMLRLAVKELPPFEQWREKQFPFWISPVGNNPDSARIFYAGLMDEALLSAVVKIERQAYENREWVLYRGYDGDAFPTTLELGDTCSHALSFGSTLLGGSFFALDATAMTYAKSEGKGVHNFLALSISPQELKDIFRVGPLHPFVQLLVNGEMFHAHTKVAASRPDAYQVKPLHGYFMESNLYCHDPLGYILALYMAPSELEKVFRAICTKSGHLFIESKQ